jgi:Spy/CpxP family protein refolding chaperone
MKYSFLAIAVLASGSAFAGGPGCDKHGAPSMERLKEELQLTDAQATQVEEILKGKHERMRAEHEAIHEETLTQLRGVLTEEQIQELQSRWQKHRHGPRSPADDSEA